MADEHFSYGGQAVIEGVMIRGRRGYALACRLSDGSIETEKTPWEPLSKRHWFLGLPIVRGTPALLEALIIGYRTLMKSADKAAKSEGIAPPSSVQYALSMAVSLVIAVGGFILAPALLVKLVSHLWPVLNTPVGNFLKYLAEGILRIAAFVAFISWASRMAEMHRVFQYHGAEHKVIHAYEAEHTFTPEAAEPYTTLHPRCGTSFIFTVFIVGILVHALVSWNHTFLFVLGSRLLLLPVVAGISYEVIRLAGRFQNSPVISAMVAPGMLMQKITTQPPTPDMMEVAIAALEGALELDGVKIEESKSREEDLKVDS